MCGFFFFFAGPVCSSWKKTGEGGREGGALLLLHVAKEKEATKRMERGFLFLFFSKYQAGAPTSESGMFEDGGPFFWQIESE